MFCLLAITSTSPKVGVTASKLVPRKEKMVLGVSKLFQINLVLLDIRLVISVSIDTFLVFLFLCFFFCYFVYIIVTGLNVSEFNQMYEMPLSDPNACETHGASRERQTSRVVCVGL